jgi:hypothetical protein
MTDKTQTTEASSFWSSSPSGVAFRWKAAGEPMRTVECASDQASLLGDPALVTGNKFLMAPSGAPPRAEAHIRLSKSGVDDKQTIVSIQHPQHLNSRFSWFGMQAHDLSATATVLDEREPVGRSWLPDPEPDTIDVTYLPRLAGHEVLQHGMYISGISKVHHPETVAP